MERRPLRTTLLPTACLVFLSISLSAVSQKQPAEASHGTVNVILANQNGLVAVTDSRLTLEDKTTIDIGTKLFKIDDSTICTVAGYYSQGGPKTSATFNVAFAAFVSDIMKVAVNRISAAPHPTFEQKAEELLRTFGARLTNNLQAQVTADNSTDLAQLEPLELTLAGYDIDGKLKVAVLTLVPHKAEYGVEFIPGPRRASTITPLCELGASPDKDSVAYTLRGEGQNIVVIDQEFFCSIAGYTDIAEDALETPRKYRNLPSVVTFEQASQPNHPMSLLEMKSLAIDLEKLTATYDRGVGGELQFAVLRGGAISELQLLPTPQHPEGSGRALATPLMRGVNTTGGPWNVGIQAADPNGYQPWQGDVTGGIQFIDGLAFHNSKFERSRVFYSGGTLAFSDDNTVEDSTLSLGANVDINRPDVERLVCHFHWTSVTQDGQPVKLDCDKIGVK
jgi:hypothetical protein